MIDLDKNIKILELGDLINSKLKNKEINYIRDLWKLDKKDLKQIGISDSEINHIKVKLQLYGIDLDSKVY